MIKEEKQKETSKKNPHETQKEGDGTKKEEAKIDSMSK